MRELEALQDLAALSGTPRPGPEHVVRACSLVRSVLNAQDAYVMRAGDPAFIRIGCECRPDDYEIKQKGYWLIWQEAARHPEAVGGLFDVRDRIASAAVALRADRPATHLAALLPAEESKSELLVVRGPWERLSPVQVQFVAAARPILALLVANVIDRARHKRQRDQLESLASIATAFSQTHATDNALDAVATALAKASGFDWVTMNVYDADCRRVIQRAMNVARHSNTETANVFRDSRSIARVTNTTEVSEPFGVTLLRHGGAALIPDVFDASHDGEPQMAAVRSIMPGLRKYWERAHILSVGMFPITFQEKVIGDLSFSSSTQHAFDADEVAFLTALTSQAATTIRGTRLYQELEQSRQELRASEERFRSLVQNATDLVTVIDATTTISYQSPSSIRLLGYEPEELVGRRLTDLTHIDDVARTVAVLHEALQGAARVVIAESRLQHRDGTWRDVELVGSNQTQHPAIRGIVLNIRDITDRKALEQQLRHQALHDPLTKLANRTRLSERLAQALARSARTGNAVSVLFMDLDNFKGVNDSLGHAAGDALLTQVAERVQECLRPGDTVARLGGDEFAILVEDVLSPQDAVAVAERVFARLTAPFEIDGKQLIVRASAGIATSGNGSSLDADSLLRDADVAMYAAKSQGKGRYREFEPSMQASMIERLTLLADLERALDHREFTLHYQPMVLLDSGQLSGFEALVRWQHPERGLLQPAEFIALAEESGAILRLGDWVLGQACRQAAAWYRRYPGRGDWSMSVNVSAKQLQDAAFAGQVANALRSSGLDPHRLILEITESVMMHDVPTMLTRLMDLKSLGVRLAIDDFGTGYSSLSYLRQFPFDLLKIDKSFIDDVGAVVGNKEITQAIIGLGKTLDVELVAEGIERGEQLTRLQSMDCEQGQGFFFARPLEPAAVEEFLQRLSGRPQAA